MTICSLLDFDSNFIRNTMILSRCSVLKPLNLHKKNNNNKSDFGVYLLVDKLFKPINRRKKNVTRHIIYIMKNEIIFN